jgi:DNA modification methylase
VGRGLRAAGRVLDPFAGSGTTLAVSAALGRRAVGVEPSAEYAVQAQDRIGRLLRPATYCPAGGNGDALPLFAKEE